ncbi:MAG: type I restriction enzyme HsdR N-terminal domain-containing protein [Chitinophagaceae bacterium]|nr:type I restriction enzyme HsdR N-terminal domain-containing protein [Chitinophagaceae bacterium]
MINLSFPKYDFKFKQENEKDFVYDEIRNKWIILTPEEWVRQNILKYLQITFNYPKSLFSVEKEIQVGELKKRFDIVIYKDVNPWMIIECKQTDVPLSPSTLYQTLAYNSEVKAPYLCLTNGNDTLLWKFENNTITALQEFPIF